MAGFGDALTQAYLQTQQQRFNEALQLADYILRQQTGQEQIRQFNVGQQESRRQFDSTQNIREREFGLNQAKHTQALREYDEAKPEREAKVKNQELTNQELADKIQRAPYDAFANALSGAMKYSPSYGTALSIAGPASGLPPDKAKGLVDQFANELAKTLPIRPSLGTLEAFSTGNLPLIASNLGLDVARHKDRVLASPTITAETAAAQIAKSTAAAALSQARATFIQTIDTNLGLVKIENEKIRAKIQGVEARYAETVTIKKARVLDAQIANLQSQTTLNKAKAATAAAGGGGMPAATRQALALHKDLGTEIRGLGNQIAAVEGLIAAAEGKLIGGQQEYNMWRRQEESQGYLEGADYGRLASAQARLSAADQELKGLKERRDKLVEMKTERENIRKRISEAYGLPDAVVLSPQQKATQRAPAPQQSQKGAVSSQPASSQVQPQQSSNSWTSGVMNLIR